MRVLLVSGIYRPEIGGPAFYIPNLAQSIVNAGHSVEVITLKQSSAKIQKENWPVNYVNRNQPMILRFVKLFFTILKSVKKSDVIFVNGLYIECGFVLRIYKKKSIAKVVGDPVFERESNRSRTVLSRSEFNSNSLNFRQFIQRRLLVLCLNTFKDITCPSEELLLLIKGWGVERPIHLIANGVEIIEGVTLTKEFDVITISRLLSLKNIDILIKACSLTGKKLAIVGSGPEEIKLKKVALYENSDVEFLGALDNFEVIEVLKKSRVFALLSDYEGQSFALLQAMAVGLPSIVSDAKGNIAVIKNGSEGLVVSPQVLTEVSNAIEKLLCNEEMQLEMGSAAKLKVKEFYSQAQNHQKVFKLMGFEKNYES
jgi:glycosyltransferase involved in cell wall biosynthesis